MGPIEFFTSPGRFRVHLFTAGEGEYLGFFDLNSLSEFKTFLSLITSAGAFDQIHNVTNDSNTNYIEKYELIMGESGGGLAANVWVGYREHNQ